MRGDQPSRQAPAQARTEGDGQLDALFHDHAAFVWRALRHLGLSAADAEDGTQEVFLVVKARLADYEERGTLRAWLFAICQNVARAQRRRHARSQPRDDVSHVPSTADDPERALQRAQAAALMKEFLGSLSESQATVFYLAEVEDFSAAELSVSLGVSVNTIYSRLRLARRRFETFVERRAQREQRR